MKRKTVGFRVKVKDNFEYSRSQSIEATEISTNGPMISFVATAEESDLNPFPEKFIVRMYSAHNLEWIEPIYEQEEEVEDEQTE